MVEFGPMAGDDSPLAILDKILQITPRDNQKLVSYLMHLRRQLELDGEEREKAMQALAELQEAYEKLTSPANRICVFLGMEGEYARIALGDSEFIANIDPKAGIDALEVGSQVRVNEAYTVVADLGPPTLGQVVKVQEALPDGRIKIAADAQGQGGRYAHRADSLAQAKIVVGDEVRMDPSYRVALEHLPHEEVRDYYLEEVPELPWDRVGGQQDAIRLIKDTIEYPLLHPEIYARFDKKPIKGILLYGPPGCGKTLIGKATAYNLTLEYSKLKGKEVEEYFMYISGPKILNMWLGETERMVREIFAIARQKAADGKLVFIFIDECESVLRTRSSGRWLNISNTLVPQFCAEMDGLVSLDNVVVILTSNRPDYIDPAVLRPERIDRKVKVNRPDKDASEAILRIYLHDKVPLDPALLKKHKGNADTTRAELVKEALAYLWRRAPESQFLNVFLRNGSKEVLYWSDLVSGALLKSAVDRAKDFAIRRAVADGEEDAGVALEDLQAAIREEYAENEIFPQSDSMEDWLKLLDFSQESVASVKPVREGDRDSSRGQVV